MHCLTQHDEMPQRRIIEVRCELNFFSAMLIRQLDKFRLRPTRAEHHQIAKAAEQRLKKQIQPRAAIDQFIGTRQRFRRITSPDCVDERRHDVPLGQAQQRLKHFDRERPLTRSQ